MEKLFNAVITYTFSNDATRENFIEYIEEIGFIEQDDQSTYALPSRRLYSNEIEKQLKVFCDKNLKKGDIVNCYWPAYQNTEFVGIALTEFKKE